MRRLFMADWLKLTGLIWVCDLISQIVISDD
jgi:hypothetical protein